MEALEKGLIDDGYTPVKIVVAKGHHLCKYCNGIAEGSNGNLLCNECRKMYGHTFFSEL